MGEGGAAAVIDGGKRNPDELRLDIEKAIAARLRGDTGAGDKPPKLTDETAGQVAELIKRHPKTGDRFAGWVERQKEVSKEDQKWGVAASLIVHYPQGPVRIGLDAKGNALKYDYLDSQGKDSQKQTNGFLPSIVKRDGVWNAVRGDHSLVKASQQGYNFALKTGEWTHQDKPGHANIYKLDGSHSNLAYIGEGPAAGKVRTTVDGAIEEIDYPDGQKIIPKYAAARRGDKEPRIAGFDRLRPQTVNGKQEWVKEVSYSKRGPGEYVPDDKGDLPYSGLSFNAKNGDMKFQSKDGEFTVQADGTHLQYLFDESGQRRMVARIPSETALAKGALKHTGIKYDKAGNIIELTAQCPSYQRYPQYRKDYGEGKFHYKKENGIWTCKELSTGKTIACQEKASPFLTSDNQIATREEVGQGANKRMVERVHNDRGVTERRQTEMLADGSSSTKLFDANGNTIGERIKNENGQILKSVSVDIPRTEIARKGAPGKELARPSADKKPVPERAGRKELIDVWNRNSEPEKVEAKDVVSTLSDGNKSTKHFNEDGEFDGLRITTKDDKLVRELHWEKGKDGASPKYIEKDSTGKVVTWTYMGGDDWHKGQQRGGAWVSDALDKRDQRDQRDRQKRYGLTFYGSGIMAWNTYGENSEVISHRQSADRSEKLEIMDHGNKSFASLDTQGNLRQQWKDDKNYRNFEYVKSKKAVGDGKEVVEMQLASVQEKIDGRPMKQAWNPDIGTNPIQLADGKFQFAPKDLAKDGNQICLNSDVSTAHYINGKMGPDGLKPLLSRVDLADGGHIKIDYDDENPEAKNPKRVEHTHKLVRAGKADSEIKIILQAKDKSEPDEAGDKTAQIRTYDMTYKRETRQPPFAPFEENLANNMPSEYFAVSVSPTGRLEATEHTVKPIPYKTDRVLPNLIFGSRVALLDQATRQKNGLTPDKNETKHRYLAAMANYKETFNQHVWNRLRKDERFGGKDITADQLADLSHRYAYGLADSYVLIRDMQDVELLSEQNRTGYRRLSMEQRAFVLEVAEQAIKQRALSGKDPAMDREKMVARGKRREPDS